MTLTLLLITACGPRTLNLEAKQTPPDSGDNPSETLPPVSGDVFTESLYCDAPQSILVFSNNEQWTLVDTDVFSFGRDEGNPAAFFDMDNDGDDDL